MASTRGFEGEVVVNQEETLTLVVCDCCPEHLFWWRQGMAHICNICFSCADSAPAVES